MLDFMPEREKFIDGVADKTWRSTNQDVERFIASDTEVKMNELAVEARGTANHWSAEWCVIDADDDIEEVDDSEDADGLHLMGALGYYEESERGIRCALSNLCDHLMTLHMGDMRTISIDGQEVRSIATGIGSICWSALDAMRIGRLGACEVCGKPFITNNERGKRRKYCSEACKQWRKVHPGETRMERVRPTPPEWRVWIDRQLQARSAG